MGTGEQGKKDRCKKGCSERKANGIWPSIGCEAGKRDGGIKEGSYSSQEGEVSVTREGDDRNTLTGLAGEGVVTCKDRSNTGECESE